MSLNAIQTAFAAGEVAPSLWARIDLAKYHIGAKLLRNMFVYPHGGAANRAGTQFIGRVKDTTHPVRLIPFTFNILQTYALEFGQNYMRVIMNGGYVLEPTKAITGATNANPCVLTIAASGYAVGDEILVAGVGGMTQLNSNLYLVSSVVGSAVSITNLDGTAINSTAFGAYTSGGTAARVYTAVSPYAASDLALLKYTQSADVMTICHPSYAPYDLTRTGHAAWTFAAITFAPLVQPPATATLAVSGAGSWNYQYQVTALTNAPLEESRPASTAVVAGVVLNQTTGVQNSITWTAVTGATSYRIYKAQPSTTGVPSGAFFGYIGTATGTTFYDVNIAPDFSKTPPQARNPLSGNNPSVVEYFQQRRVFAGSNAAPQTFWATQPGSYYNMDVSNPVSDSDAITATIAAKQVNTIQWMVPMSSMIILTKAGAWKTTGGGQTGAAMTPSNVSMQPQTYAGCSALCPPIVVNYDAIYLQSLGSTVRMLTYNLYADAFIGQDLSIISNHLFYGHQILEWAYAEEPQRLIWCVREDGVMLTLTYLKEQDVYAWTHHDTQGSFLSVTSIVEGLENVLYVVVKRTIPGVNGGAPVQYVERLHTRNFLTAGVADPTQVWFVDCGAQYSGAPATTISGLGFLEGATVSVLADGSVVSPKPVVTNGAITLTHAASVVTIGLPYVAQLQTLGLDSTDQGGTSQGKRKKISAVTVRFENSRGAKVGHDANTLRAIKERTQTTPYGTALPLFTGDERVVLDPLWDVAGGIFIQQDFPLPMTVLGVISEDSLGDN